MGVWEQERAYNLNDNVSRGFMVRSFIKNNIFFAIRGHLQPLEVNSRTFYDISAKKCIFRADIIAFAVMTFCRLESLIFGECYSVLQQRHLNKYLLRFLSLVEACKHEKTI